MAFSTGVSYCAGLGFLKYEDSRRRKLCLVIPIVTDLSLLGFFKYANFGVESLSAALARDPDLHEARFNLALAYAKSGRRPEAAAAARELLQRLPPAAPQRPEVERLLRAVQ